MVQLHADKSVKHIIIDSKDYCLKTFLPYKTIKGKYGWRAEVIGWKYKRQSIYGELGKTEDDAVESLIAWLKNSLDMTTQMDASELLAFIQIKFLKNLMCSQKIIVKSI